MNTNIYFNEILSTLVSDRGIAVFQDPAKCRALLYDYAGSGFKREIRLLLQALEAGAYKELFLTTETIFGIKKMIRKLQEDYAIAADAAEETVMLLAKFGKNKEKTAEEKIAKLEKLAQEGGNYKAQYELGLLLEEQGKYKEANFWYKKF